MATQSNGVRLHYIHPEHIIGDVHPYYHDGRWYVYYLAPGFHSKLMTSSNLLDWEQVPISHTPPEADDGDLAPYYVLGVFRDEISDVYRTYHGWTGSNMYSHTSEDLLHWDFAPLSYRVLAQYQRYASQRDPYVFWNEEEQQYWCVTTCRVKGYDASTDGAVGYASSTDLQHWEGRGDLYFTGTTHEPEVPQVFQMGETWVLLASIHTGVEVGKPSYWTSDSPTGPWTAHLTDSLDGEDLAAANVGFDGERWLLMGWIPLTTTVAHGQYTWGGHLAFPRVVRLMDDGSLGTQLEPGIGAAIRGELLFDAASAGLNATASNSDGETVTELPDRLDRFDADLFAASVSEGGSVGLRIAGLIDIGVAGDGQLVIGRRGQVGTPYAHLSLPPQSHYAMRIIVEGDIVEMFVNDRYSLCARLPADAGATVVQLVTTGTVNVDHLHVYALRDR